jgi:hypothetical protein
MPFLPVPPLHLEIDGDLVRALRATARHRDVNARSLAREILEVVVAENLVSAVLDTDREPPPPRPRGRPKMKRDAP